MLDHINQLGNWLLSHEGGEQYKPDIIKIRNEWIEAETLLESAVHWSQKVGSGDMYELNDGAPPFKAAFLKIEQCSQNWRALLEQMSVPFQGDRFPEPLKEQ